MNTRTSKQRFRFQDLIIAEIDDYYLVNKPPYLSSLEDRNDPQNLLSLAKEVDNNLQICHRLDKETSGIVLVAKNLTAYKHFAAQLESRQVKKVYHAILSSIHRYDNFEANEPLFTTSKKSRVDFRSGKPSFTLFHTLEIFKKHTLIKCFPVSGRMHQIRAHLAYHHSPILSDSSYGGQDAFLSQLKKNYNRSQNRDELPLIGRTALHAYELAFKDLNNQEINFTAEYPKDFAVLLKQLRKYN
ncbi:MAG: RNA pseudouridine synthase [Bacteroidota bacterium]